MTLLIYEGLIIGLAVDEGRIDGLIADARMADTRACKLDICDERTKFGIICEGRMLALYDGFVCLLVSSSSDSASTSDCSFFPGDAYCCELGSVYGFKAAGASR